jgi:hypothetical protein
MEKYKTSLKVDFIARDYIMDIKGTFYTFEDRRKTGFIDRETEHLRIKTF